MAQLLQDTNRLSEAEPLVESSLLIFVRSLGADHPNSMTVRANLRLIYMGGGHSSDEAEAKIIQRLREEGLA